MGSVLWSHEKNGRLLAERGLWFKAEVAAIEAGACWMCWSSQTQTATRASVSCTED
jgi:hypothetical protein